MGGCAEVEHRNCTVGRGRGFIRQCFEEDDYFCLQAVVAVVDAAAAAGGDLLVAAAAAALAAAQPAAAVLAAAAAAAAGASAVAAAGADTDSTASTAQCQPATSCRPLMQSRRRLTPRVWHSFFWWRSAALTVLSGCHPAGGSRHIKWPAP